MMSYDVVGGCLSWFIDTVGVWGCYYGLVDGVDWDKDEGELEDLLWTYLFLSEESMGS